MKRYVWLLALALLPAPSVASAARVKASPLDGRWTFTWTRAELRNYCSVCPPGRFVVEFRDGHFSRLIPKPVLHNARFSVRGTLVTFVFPPPAPVGVVANRRYTMRWSIYRDRLTWSRVTGLPPLQAFFIEPWIRVH
jgi:hypothetical protein